MKRPKFLKSGIKSKKNFFHTIINFPFVNYCAVYSEYMRTAQPLRLFESCFFDFMADFKNLGLFMKRNHIFDKNLKQYGHF